MGTKKANQRFVKPWPDNRAIAAIGEKFGGCGINLDNIAKIITEAKKKFLFIILNKSSSDDLKKE